MSEHTTFKVGGKADYFVRASSLAEVKYVLDLAKSNNIPIFVIGSGSNLLVLDGGIRGIVLKPELKDISIEGETVTCGSGVSLTLVSKLASENSLAGLEFACGIPGTIGGAIKMNAGAYGSEMKDIVKTTTYIDDNGDLATLSGVKHEFEYRKSFFSKQSYVIISTVLKIKKGDKTEILKKMKTNINSRVEKQPVEMPSAGSTFKRGKDFVTAALIDEAGLKGYRIGGAEVSTKHAGFIVNTGNATAKDILELIKYVKTEIKNKFNKDIELEILVIGEE